MTVSKGMRTRWTPEMKRDLLEMYTKFGPEKARRKLNRKYGLKLSYEAVRTAAARFGAIEESPNGGYRLPEVADLLGCTVACLWQRIYRKTLKIHRHGRFYWVYPDEFAKLERDLSPLAWPAFTAQEAADLLGYTRSAVTYWAADGNIESRIYKGALYVRRSDVELIQRYLKQSGNSRIYWPHLRAFAAKEAA